MRKGIGVLCMLIGFLMLVSAFGLIMYNRAEETSAGENAAALAGQIAHIVREKEKPAENEQVLSARAGDNMREMPVLAIEGNEYIGYLEIPSLSLSLPVMSDWTYPQLRVAPCRYTGSVYDDSLIIMAHNYDRHFGRIGSLQPGDPVQFIDAEGNINRYVVESHEQLGKYDVDKMTQGDWDMTLFSCTYGGGARVTVRLKRVLAYE